MERVKRVVIDKAYSFITMHNKEHFSAIETLSLQLGDYGLQRIYFI